MECHAHGACPSDALAELLERLECVSGEPARPVHQLEMVLEGPSYAKNVKGPQLRLLHELQHLDSDSSPGTHIQALAGETLPCLLSSLPHLGADAAGISVCSLWQVSFLRGSRCYVDNSQHPPPQYQALDRTAERDPLVYHACKQAL